MTDFGRPAGDMLKSVYDPNNDGVISIMNTRADMETSTYDPEVTGIVADAQKLESQTKAQVRDHTPKTHTHPYAPLAHKTRHQHGGADEIDVTGLSGLLADDQGKAGSHLILEGPDYSVVIQGTWTILAPSTTAYKGQFYNSTHDDADEVHWLAHLAAGTYTCKMLSETYNIYGISDIYIDADEVASFDWYSGGAVRRVLKSRAGIVVAASGLKTIKLKVDGKNPSSTNHSIYLSSLYFFRTA